MVLLQQSHPKVPQHQSCTWNQHIISHFYITSKYIPVHVKLNHSYLGLRCSKSIDFVFTVFDCSYSKIIPK